VREPFQDLGVRSEAQGVEAVVSGERSIEVGRGGVAWSGRKKEKKEEKR